MELASGRDLYRQMKRMKRPFREDEALRIVEGILKALVHLHEQGIAQRDLKLESIMLVDENRLTTKLIDFGIAPLRQNGADGLCTGFCGTRQYCAPEVASKRPHVPERVAMWSVRILPCALLARMLQFRAADSSHLRHAILHHEVQFPGAVWERWSECTRELIRALLSKNPAQRPQSRGVPPCGELLVRDQHVAKHRLMAVDNARPQISTVSSGRS